MYKKKGLKNKWTHKLLNEAIGKVQRKELTLRAAVETYGIPRSTLSDHVRGVSSKRYGGCSTVLTLDEEREIVVTCQVLAEMGFPLTRGYVEVVVRDYLQSEGRGSAFGSSGLPGRSWWEGLLSRWPSLAERKPQHLSRQRAQCASQEVVDAFFGRLKNLFETSGLKDAPDLDKCIWNCDETGFCTAVASQAVLTRRGAKEVHETAGGSGRDYITVLGKCLVLWCVTPSFSPYIVMQVLCCKAISFSCSTPFF